ncbi:hypothetical protein CK203_088560 [Vitis vinifera]|uniref:Uncharacterized protein n=1 Tax=Vitis vinifera TaxID=29760 RepID=A0A438F1F8_VITVI|nr:hypothetical protein CK203_088560 [Vitis vinifera]
MQRRRNGRRQQPDPNHPRAERMLEEEAARYGSEVNWGVSGHKGLPLLISFVLVGLRRGSITTILGCEGGNSAWKWVTKTKRRRTYREKDGCWDLVEVNSVDPMVEIQGGLQTRRLSKRVGRKTSSIGKESSLIKFSHFLGFSTEGLEKEILNFLGKIRKRREKIVGKGLLETSRFERELKRLECSVNYEGDTRKKGPFQGRGNPSTVVQ